MRIAIVLFLIAAVSAPKAELVVQAKRLSFGGADKYALFRVQVLQVFKKPEGAKLLNKLSVSAYSWKDGVPEGVSTLYLERHNKTSSETWRLVGGEASTGVSHNTK